MIISQKEKEHLHKIVEQNQFILYEYKPSLLYPLLISFERMKIVRRCRFFLEYLHKGHFLVYYLAVNDDLVGYCVVSPGGRKLKCSNINDIILGPYYIVNINRGKGYGKQLVNMVLKNYPKNYSNAYDWIAKTNIPSIKASLSCGFVPVSSLNVVGLLRNLVEDDDGKYTLFRYKSHNE